MKVQVAAVLSLTLVSAASVSEISSKFPDEKGLTRSLTQKISSVTDQSLTGFDLEGWSDAERNQWITATQEYVAFRKGKLPPENMAYVTVGCFRNSGNSPYCPYLVENWVKSAFPDEVPPPEVAEEYEDEEETPKPKGKLRLAEFREDWSRPKTRSSKLSRREIVRLLHGVRSPEEFSTLLTEVIDKYDCQSTSLPVALGLKAEEYFPEPKFRDSARKLYEMAAKCGSRKDADAELARYRLALLYIWDNKCDDAKDYLKTLSDKSSDYGTRALYWRAWCAKQDGDKLAFHMLRSELIKVNPLAYHSLNLMNVSKMPAADMVSKDPTLALMRTYKDEELNRWIRMIELLQRENSPELAGEFIQAALKRTENVEVEGEFRLYLAVLAQRNGSHLKAFKILSRLIAEDHRFLTESVLKLYFPLKRFQELSKHQEKLNPYFVAAVIRQESGFVENARSPAGAIGLMQLMPSTARRLAKVSKHELLSPEVNIRLGVRYLNSLVNRFQGDLDLALAAYNAGPQRVDDWLKRYPTENRLLFLDLIPFAETRSYVTLISRNFFWYQNIYLPE